MCRVRALIVSRLRDEAAAGNTFVDQVELAETIEDPDDDPADVRNALIDEARWRQHAQVFADKLSRSDGTGSVWKLADRTAPLPRLSPSSSRSTSASCRAAMIISRSANCSRGRRRTSCHTVVAPMALLGLSPISAPQNTHSDAVFRFSTGWSNAPSILMSLSASPLG